MEPTDLLAGLLKSGNFSDLVILCRGNEFKVHKAIVCPQSLPITATVATAFKENAASIIAMHSFSAQIVKRLVQYLYTRDYDDFPDVSSPELIPVPEKVSELTKEERALRGRTSPRTGPSLDNEELPDLTVATAVSPSLDRGMKLGAPTANSSGKKESLQNPLKDRLRPVPADKSRNVSPAILPAGKDRNEFSSWEGFPTHPPVAGASAMIPKDKDVAELWVNHNMADPSSVVPPAVDIIKPTSTPLAPGWGAYRDPVSQSQVNWQKPLFQHIRVSAIGFKYQVPGLAELAKARIKALLQETELSSNSLAEASRLAMDLAGDPDVLSLISCAMPDELVEELASEMGDCQLEAQEYRGHWERLGQESAKDPPEHGTFLTATETEQLRKAREAAFIEYHRARVRNSIEDWRRVSTCTCMCRKCRVVRRLPREVKMHHGVPFLSGGTR